MATSSIEHSLPTRREYLRLVVLGGAIGVPAAAVAALFLGLVHYLEGWLWTDLPDALGESSPPWYLVLGLPVVGAAIVLLARVLLPGDGGHQPLEGLAVSPTPVSHLPGIALAALATLAFGAVLGPEAPVVALGSGVALALTTFARLGEKERGLLSVAGAFAAISALFGGPLVGGVLLLEGAVGLGAAVIPMLLPGFVAAALGYLIFIGLGDWGGLDAPGLVVPDLPLYDGTSVVDLVAALAIGVATAATLVPIRRAAGRTARDGAARLGMPALLLGGGAAVGGLALAADLLGADSQDVLFSGQASIPSLLTEDSTFVLVVLVAAKGLAYAICLACGFRGGAIFPAIFLGVGFAMFPVVWFDVSPTVAVAMGAAAGTAAQARLVLSAMLFAAVLVGSQGTDTVPAAVLAAVASWLTTTALDRAESPAAPGSQHPA